MTHFVTHELPLPDGLSLWLDGNSKITANDGSYDDPAANSLSLPSISSCPGATPSCLTSCYVQGLERENPELALKYRHNARVLQRLFFAPASALRAAQALGHYIADALTAFRWHVSGDVMHDRHAAWIVAVCNAAPRTTFWIYTRTFQVVRTLALAPNLTINLSVDRDNARDVEEALGPEDFRLRHPMRVCYMATSAEDTPCDLPRGSVIFPDYVLRGRDLDDPTTSPWWQGLTLEQRRQVCPPDFFGQSQHHRCGPCNRCIRPPSIRPT